MTAPRLVAAGSAEWTGEQVKPGDAADLRWDEGIVGLGDRPRLFHDSRSGSVGTLPPSRTYRR